MIRALRSLSWNWFLAAYVALIAVLLFTPLAAHAASTPPIITAPNATCAENMPSCTLPISKSAKASSYTQVRVETLDIGSAKPNVDFVSVAKVITFGNSQLTAAVTITIINNSTYQGDRIIPIKLTCVRFCQLTNTYVPPTIIIKDDEVAPVPTPTPAPLPTEPVVSPNGPSGESAIADNFDVSQWLQPGEVEPQAPDPVGAFRFTCLAGHLLKDDPIVYPGQPGKSHLHQFFGNTGTNASSTYQSLRTTGGSTCTRSADVSPQRSAYWMPAMLDGAGSAVKPDWVNTYYKRLPPSDPQCAKTTDPAVIGKCIETPNGLRFILGYNMTTMSGGPTDLNSLDSWAMGFDCQARDFTGNSLTGLQRTIAAIVATGKCPAGSWLRAYILFPSCWDGKNLDVADHRSNMSFGVVAIGCPADHPYTLPEIAISAFYTTDANFVAGRWSLASDDAMAAMLGKPVAAGTTLHFDYWEAWSQLVKDLWNGNCLDKHLTCSSGNVGDGRQIKGMQIDYAPIPNHVLVPLSSIP